MSYNKGKKLLSERFYLTWAGEQMFWTVRMTLKMRDPVDGDLLRQAVESTRQRYPYYQVKLGIRKDTEGTEYFVYEATSMVDSTEYFDSSVALESFFVE